MTTMNPLRPTPGAPRPYHFPRFSRRTLSRTACRVWLVPLADRSLVNVHLLVRRRRRERGRGTRRRRRTHRAAARDRYRSASTRRPSPRRPSGWASRSAASRAGTRRAPPSRRCPSTLTRASHCSPRWSASRASTPPSSSGSRRERLADILQARAEPGRLADEHVPSHALCGGRAIWPHLGRIAGVGRAADARRRARLPRTAGARAGEHLIIAGAFDPRPRCCRRRRASAAGRGGSPIGTSRPAPSAARRVVHRRSARIGAERDPGWADRDPATHPRLLPRARHGQPARRRLRQPPQRAAARGARLHVRRACVVRPATLRRTASSPRTAVETERHRAGADRADGAARPDARRGARDRELREVKDFLIGVFPLRFEATGGVAAAIEPLAVYGLGDDFWQTYRTRLEAVSPTEACHASRASSSTAR